MEQWSGSSSELAELVMELERLGLDVESAPPTNAPEDRPCSDVDLLRGGEDAEEKPAGARHG